jgi:hypothetical protein
MSKNPVRNYAIEYLGAKAGVSTEDVASAIAAIVPGGATGSVFGDVVGALLGPLFVKGIHGDEITPDQFVANTDDFNPAGRDALTWRLSTDASRNLTGIAAPTTPGEVHVLLNVGAFDLVLKHDATSAAANRFLCPDDADVTLQKDSTVLLVYDGTSTRWRVVGGTGGGANFALTTKGDLHGFSTADVAISIGTEGYVPISRAAAAPGIAWEGQSLGIEVVIGDGVTAMATGSKGYIEVPFACTITAARLLADVAGAVVVDVKSCTYAGFPTTATICSVTPPTIAATNQKSQDTSLSSWTVAIAAGTILEFNVNSVTTIKRATLSLTVRRT